MVRMATVKYRLQPVYEAIIRQIAGPYWPMLKCARKKNYLNVNLTLIELKIMKRIRHWLNKREN